MKRVLVVEDDADIRSLVSDLLIEAGYFTDTASTGDEGYTRLATYTYEGLVLDMGLPGLDGLSILRKLAEEGHPRPSTVIMSAFGWDEVHKRVGCRMPYVGKPFTADEFLETVQRFIGPP